VDFIVSVKALGLNWLPQFYENEEPEKASFFI
jgi:hypothetical protein